MGSLSAATKLELCAHLYEAVREVITENMLEQSLTDPGPERAALCALKEAFVVGYQLELFEPINDNNTTATMLVANTATAKLLQSRTCKEICGDECRRSSVSNRAECQRFTCEILMIELVLESRLVLAEPVAAV